MTSIIIAYIYFASIFQSLMNIILKYMFTLYLYYKLGYILFHNMLFNNIWHNKDTYHDYCFS